MGVIEIELTDQDISTLLREGELTIPVDEALIDAHPAVRMIYAEDRFSETRLEDGDDD